MVPRSDLFAPFCTGGKPGQFLGTDAREFAMGHFYAILERRMAVADPTHHLHPRVRAARRKLLLQDSVALLTLVLIVAVLSGLTYLLHHSFENHRQELGQRWRQRGEAELRKGQSQAAIEALHAALSYLPDRRTEIELAEALAQAGRTQEAVAYFNTLRDQEPGSGIVNLQLARLAVRQNQEAQAISDYQTALDGTWEGDGYERRRDVRLEMARYLIQVHQFSRARTELLIAAGNAPDKPALKLEIAGLLEQCQSPADALAIYRNLAHRRNAPWAALAGAGRTAYELGEYALAHAYLDRASDARAFRQQPQAEQAMIEQKLKTTGELLALYPADDLTVRERAARILEDVRIARNLFENCQAPVALQPLAVPPVTTPQIASGSLPVNPLARAAARAKSLLLPSRVLPVTNLNTTAQALAARWAKVPQNLRLFDLEQNPEMEQMLMQLVYDTEKDAASRCGTPQGNDALLYMIAQAPYQVEQR
jgi:tetratricopeptide (TPR) repeat protein